MIFPYLFITGLLLLSLLFIFNRGGLIPLSIFRPIPTTVVLWLMILFWITVSVYDSYPNVADSLNVTQRFYYGYAPQYPLRILGVTLLSGLGLLLGIALVNMKASRKSIKVAWEQWYLKPLTESKQTRLLESLFWLGLSIAILFCVLYVVEVGGLKKLPLVVLLSDGSYLEIVISREDSFKLLDSYLVPVYNMLRMFFFPIWISFAYLIARTRRRNKYWLRFVIVLFIGIVYNALSTALSPIANIFLHLFFCEVVIQGVNPFRQFRAYVLGVAAIVAILFVFMSLYPNSSLQAGPYIMKILNEQIFLKGLDTFNNAAVFTNFYPLQGEEFVGFRGIPKIASVLDLNLHHINNYLYLELNPFVTVTSGFYNGPWFLYDYALFSYPATFVGSWLLGLILASLGEFFRRRPKDILLVVCFIQCVAASRYIFDTSLSTWLISKGGILGLLFYLLIYRLARVKKNNEQIVLPNVN